jgi:hypothetical protein
MNNAQNEVIEWWYGRRDYRSGIELLSRYCKNKTIINTLSKHGKERFQPAVKKLHYEVTKAVHLNWLNMPDDVVHDKTRQDGKESLADIPPGETQEEEKNIPSETFFPSEQKKNTGDENQYPRVIRRLKYEYSNLYNKRSQLHKNMRNVEQTNTDKNNELRSDFLSEIKSISKQLEFYFGFLEKYETAGTIPEETEIWPPAKKQVPEEPKTYPELKKLMWSLKSEQSKDGFRLLYQQRTKADKENPMPQNSKRKVIELRMKLREIKLNETLALIEQLENAD